jgi:hypothetical protein
VSPQGFRALLYLFTLAQAQGGDNAQAGQGTKRDKGMAFSGEWTVQNAEMPAEMRCRKSQKVPNHPI